MKNAIIVPVMSFNCPLCGTEMEESKGNQIHPNDPKFGVSLRCTAPHPAVCHAQEVAGHGDNVKQAYEVVMAKYKKG